MHHGDENVTRVYLRISCLTRSFILVYSPRENGNEKKKIFPDDGNLSRKIIVKG